MTKRKTIKLLLLLFTISLLNLTKVAAFDVSHSGSGSGGGGSSYGTYYGGFQGGIYGVRVTFVDKNGDRLKIKLKNKTLVSDSVDFYGSRTDGSITVNENSTHSVCTKSNGEKTLCDHKDAAKAKMTFNAGGYTWKNASDYLGFSICNYKSDSNCHIADSDHFASLEKESNYGYVEKLFKLLMGADYKTIEKESGSNCKENNSAMQNAYIIYEVLTQQGKPGEPGLIATGEEFAMYYPRSTGSPCYSWLPDLSGNLQIPNDTGNLGNNYFKAVPKGSKATSCGTGGSNLDGFLSSSSPSNGYYMGILRLEEFKPEKNKKLKCSANYYIESTCTNCNSKTDSAAIQIQDMNDWDAIQSSKDSDNVKIKNQYESIKACSGTIFCRQEYKVIFPKLSDFTTEKEFNVSTGRYFTVNNNVAPFANGVANFGPINITKTKECTFVPDTDEEGKPVTTVDAQKGCIKSKVTIGDFGTINLTYQESKGKKYRVEKDLIEDTNRTTKLKTDFSTDVYKMEQTKHYKLPNNIYQFIEIGTGTPVMGNKATDNHYTNLKTSTLPVSFENYATQNDKGGGTIKLEYTLPNGSLKKAYEGGSNYFGNQEGENIYKKYINADGNLTDADEIKQAKESLCAQNYGYSTSKSSKFYQCASEKQDSTVSNCNNIKNKNQDDGYICDVSVCKWGEKVCPNGKCQEKCTETCTATTAGKDEWQDYYWNSAKKKCCKNGDTCDGDKTDGTCRIEGGKYYDALDNEITEEDYKQQCTCQILGNGVYLGNFDHKGEKLYSLSKYYEQCLNTENCAPGEPCTNTSCPDAKKNECPQNTWINGDPCLRCPSGACPMPGGVCPGVGGIDIIYRPIDLINPFPGQVASGRKTGDNWCAEVDNGTTTTSKCSGNSTTKTASTKINDNATVYYQIQNNRKVNDYAVYSKTPVYSVTLNSASITKIKNYNNKKAYDNWDSITCTTQMGCKSDFLHSSSYGFNLKGTCKTTTGGNLLKCAEE